MPAYRKQVEAFRRKFGREMRPEDPFFFDPRSDTPQFRPPDATRQALKILAELKAALGPTAEADARPAAKPKVMAAGADGWGFDW
ncbi:MAG TPA: hypothetical protein VMH28_14625 [Candidatus Acidoferrales bacterium]|nr:hypothetical protein [Candidatus Acidoferrales bacterium]